MSSAFHYVHFRAFAQATEDEEKVRAALRFVAGRDTLEIAETVLEGHHKNPIRLMECELKARAAIDAFFRRVAGSSSDALPTLVRQLDERLDGDHVFYLRLGKQDAALGRLALTTGEDAIQARAKVAAFPAKADVARATLAAYLDSMSRNLP